MSTMAEIQELAEQVWGPGARARRWRGTVRVETFELGEVLTVRHPDPEVAPRMAEAALRAQAPAACSCAQWESCEACFRRK